MPEIFTALRQNEKLDAQLESKLKTAIQYVKQNKLSQQ